MPIKLFSFGPTPRWRKKPWKAPQKGDWHRHKSANAYKKQANTK